MVKLISKEFAKFVAVGLLNTLLTYLIYLLLDHWVNYTMAYAVGYSAGIVFSYFMNTFFVFKSKPSIKKGMQFPLVYGVQFILSEVILYICINRLGLNAKLAPLLVIILTIPVTFLLSKLIIKRPT
ncbi:GtrA family protein [Paenibacillus athensensis]|uniref:Polysaccharide synthesis protein GtrA n=1 Tax=Paenibacillus athensensis TaxID=1967502 RepID=A0A4Y8Q6E9_9BACL|nr:GtrA family protein [Paenibacillus athensensis]